MYNDYGDDDDGCIELYNVHELSFWSSQQYQKGPGQIWTLTFFTWGDKWPTKATCQGQYGWGKWQGPR